ncbi:MAG: hypothetical protein ACQ9MH_15145 [Nitrospinales bacterium]
MIPRRFSMVVLSISILLILFGTIAHAMLVVDTGAPDEANMIPAWALMNNEMALQNLAAQFTLDNDYYLTELLGYIEAAASYDSSRLIDLKIYGDLANTLDFNSLLYSQSFTFTVNTFGDWFGVGGVNWFLPQGTYWISFEPQPGVSGFMGAGVPNPVRHR